MRFDFSPTFPSGIFTVNHLSLWRSDFLINLIYANLWNYPHKGLAVPWLGHNVAGLSVFLEKGNVYSVFELFLLDKRS